MAFESASRHPGVESATMRVETVSEADERPRQPE